MSTEHAAGDATTDAWAYTSNEFRGERGSGTWTVHISDRWATDQGTLNFAGLYFYAGQSTEEDVFVFTNEYSDYDGRFGHARTIAGGIGDDTLNAAAVTSCTRIDLTARRGTIDGVSVRLMGVEDVTSGDKTDLLIGSAAGNVLIAGRGNDRVESRGGADEIYGGSGRDKLYGGRGSDLLCDGGDSDWLYGGRGRDVFDLAFDGKTDRVCDFQDGIDRVCLSGLRFGDLDLRDLGDGRVQVRCLGEKLILDDGGIGHLTAVDLSASDFLFA